MKRYTSTKIKDAPDPAVKRVADAFHDAFLERFGFKPDPRQYSRFGKEIKPLLATWGELEVLRLINEFFSTRDPRVVRSDYTMMAFLGLAQYLRVRQTGASTRDDRTLRNIDAAARATGRR